MIRALPKGSRFSLLVLARCAPRQKLTIAIANAVSNKNEESTQ